MKSKFTRKRPTLQQLQDQFRAGMPSDASNVRLPAYMLETPRASRKPREEGQKNAHEEQNSQVEVVTYLHKMCPKVLVASSCNGELWPLSQYIDKGRFFGWMKKLKQRGLLKGDADLRLTWFPSRCIFIEMKKKKGGVISDAQELVGEKLRSQGFKVYVLEGGVDELKEIIRLENIPCREHQSPNNL